MVKLENIQLDNGLTIYLYNDKRRHTTFFSFITFCGGETKHFKYKNKVYNMQDGVAHILEHYIVECNENGNFLDKLGEMQMTTNASTSSKITSFYFETVENVSYGINTVLEGINNVIFSTDKLEKLKNPIFQEIRGKLDNKFYHLSKLRINNLFTSIDYRDIGGEIEDVSNTSIEQLKTFYEAFYQPYNQFIIVAGNFDKKDVINDIKSFYKKYEYVKRDVSIIPYNEKIKVSKKKDYLYFPTPEDYVDISFKIDKSAYSPEDLLSIDFYLNCFSENFFGVSSSAYKELVDNKIITNSIRCGTQFIDNFIVYSIGAYTSNKDVFIETILDRIRKLDSFDEESYTLDKNNSYLYMVLREENIFKMIMPFINNVVLFDYPYLDDPNDFLSNTFEDYVNNIKSLDFSNYTITTVKDNKKVSD